MRKIRKEDIRKKCRAAVYPRPSSRRVNCGLGCGLVLAALVSITLLASACSAKAPIECFTNADCADTHACVDGQCISDVSECETLGVFEEVTYASKISH
jgi:hypothetical protein